MCKLRSAFPAARIAACLTCHRSAWAGLGTITRADAMREYIALVRSLDAAWNPST